LFGFPRQGLSASTTFAVVIFSSCFQLCDVLEEAVQLPTQDPVDGQGLMTTVHAMTATQLTVDGPSRGGKDWEMSYF